MTVQNPITSRQYMQLRHHLWRQTEGCQPVPFPVALPTTGLMAFTMNSDASRFVRHVTAYVYEPGFRPHKEDCFRVTAVSVDRGRSFYLVQNGRGTVTDGRYATPVRLRIPATMFPDLHPDAPEFALYCLQAALHYVPPDHAWGKWEPMRAQIEQAAANQLRGARYLLGVAHRAYRLPGDPVGEGLNSEACLVEAGMAYEEAAAGYQAIGLAYSYGHCLLEKAITFGRLGTLLEREDATPFARAQVYRRRAIAIVDQAHEVFRPIRGATNVSYRTKHLRDDLLTMLHGTVGF